MTAPDAFVYVQLDSVDYLVGRLWTYLSDGRQSASFEYDPEWLVNDIRFSLQPALSLNRGLFHTEDGKTMFGALGDSAPDRWGRVLMRRAERRYAEIGKRQLRTLGEIDYLLGVDDQARQGALRFASELGGDFLSNSTNPVPPLIALPKLLAAAQRIGDDSTNIDEDLQLLLAPGSSLGGARPKASVIDTDGWLAIAKFPSKGDDFDTVKWEAVELQLAEAAGIQTTKSRVTKVGAQSVLIVDRFDRDQSRIPFLSAMSMLGARDHEPHSYMEIADELRQHGAQAVRDIRALWRRIVFNVLATNTDDHLRNHGFLYVGGEGWVLSPAYDLNPVPLDVKARVLSTSIDIDDPSASLDLALAACEYFELKLSDARSIVAEVAEAVNRWREVAKSAGLSNSEIERMSSAFDHDDMTEALKMKV